MADFPSARFQRAGSSSEILADLEASWALLSAQVQVDAVVTDGRATPLTTTAYPTSAGLVLKSTGAKEGEVEWLQDDVLPEIFGPGYDGATDDDWDPAITAAWALALTLDVGVFLSGTYGIATTIVAPGGHDTQEPQIRGQYGTTTLVKIADVPILQLGGTAPDDFRNAGLISGVAFDGGSNPDCTAPLVIASYMETLAAYDISCGNNYGSAIVAEYAWDSHWKNLSVILCGATDDANAAVILTSNVGDGGNATNNQ
jgi:hypothetical protein